MILANCQIWVYWLMIFFQHFKIPVHFMFMPIQIYSEYKMNRTL